MMFSIIDASSILHALFDISLKMLLHPKNIVIKKGIIYIPRGKRYNVFPSRIYLSFIKK